MMQLHRCLRVKFPSFVVSKAGSEGMEKRRHEVTSAHACSNFLTHRFDTKEGAYGNSEPAYIRKHVVAGTWGR